MNPDIRALRSLILESQHLKKRSSEPVEAIVSDLCGLQYDPYPAIHLNQYMMLWNRKKDFTPQQLDDAAYRDFRVMEAWTFRRNLFFVPCAEFARYRAATRSIVRWGDSDEGWLRATDSPPVREAERALREGLTGQPGMTAKQIWDHLGLAEEWHKYRREHGPDYDLPIFRAFYRMARKRELLVCGRNPGTFREPVYLLKESASIDEWPDDGMDEGQAVAWMVEKLVSSLGVTDPVHVAHLSGLAAREVAPVFQELASRKRIVPLPSKIGRKNYYVHASKAHLLNAPPAEDTEEVRLISPMDTVVRDKKWLETFFDYSFFFEYFQKKGMKWPLSILVGHQFVGYLDCKMEWRTQKFIIKEKNLFASAVPYRKGIDAAIRELAAFHGAKEIIEKK